MPSQSLRSARPGQTEASTDLVEVDPDRSTALAAVSGDVGLLDEDRAGELPPSGGLGGSSVVLGFRGSLPARALGAGVSAGVFAGVCAGLSTGANSKSV